MCAPKPSRRQVISGGVAAMLATSAGCLDVFSDVAGTENGRDDADRVLTLTLDRIDGSLRDRYVEDLAETEPDWDEEAFDATLDGEVYTTQYRKPFFDRPDDPVYAEREGTYYRLGSVVVDEATTTRPVLRLFGGDDDADGDATAQLPAGDERAVRIAHMAARARGNVGGMPVGLVERGGYVYRDEDAVEASQLLSSDGPDRVVHRDKSYRVEVSRETFHEPVYRATADPVAESPERMEAILRAKFVEARFARDDRSREALEVLREAQHGGYSESHPYSSGYEEVLRALHERAYLDGNIRKDATASRSNRTMLLYDDVYYEYRLRFEAADGG